MFYKDVVRGLTTKKANLTRREILIGKNRCYKLLKRVHFEREKEQDEEKVEKETKENRNCFVPNFNTASIIILGCTACKTSQIYTVVVFVEACTKKNSSRLSPAPSGQYT